MKTSLELQKPTIASTDIRLRKKTMYFTFLCILVFASSGYGEVEKAVVDKVNAGIKAGNAIVEVLGDEKYSKHFGKISKVAMEIGPFLGAIGPAVALISAFMPESPELQYMKRKFAEVDQKFDKVFTQIDEVKNLILEKSLLADYGQYERTISNLSNRLQQFLNAPTNAVQGQKDTFIRVYESQYNGAAFILWKGMKKGFHTSAKIPNAAMEYTENHRGKVQRLMKGFANLIIQGVKVQLSYLVLKGRNYTYTYEQEKCTWDSRIKQLITHMQSVDQTVTNLWHEQVGTDLNKKLASLNGISHSRFADKFYEFLTEKYDWRDWHIVVYNELHGGNHHWVKWCGGYHSFRNHGRNIVMASVDQEKEAIDTGRAKRLLKGVSTGFCHIGWWDLSYIKCFSYEAKKIYVNYLMDEFKNGCNYAATGVIEDNANVQHRAPSSRFTSVESGKFILHAFG